MDNIRLVCYADENMTISQKRCIESSAKYGITDVHAWSREMIQQTEFYQLNREILDTPRGSGLWAWKSFIIYKAMLDMEDGSILLYSDVGVELINDPQHIINVMDEDVFLFGNNWNHVDWCKGDVLSIINNFHVDNDFNVLVAKQVQASAMFFRISKESKEFVKFWLMYCQMPNLINDEPSDMPNYQTFRDHRHDQAICTSLALEYETTLHYWPASYSNGAFIYEKIEQYKGDNYPVIFLHHRQRNSDY
jgi:hypothetical protein